jgi:hypothetical protein
VLNETTTAVDAFEGWLPGPLFAGFALLAAGGAFWIVFSHRGRRAGGIAVLLTCAVFLLLFAVLKLALAPGETP